MHKLCTHTESGCATLGAAVDREAAVAAVFLGYPRHGARKAVLSPVAVYGDRSLCQNGSHFVFLSFGPTGYYRRGHYLHAVKDAVCLSGAARGVEPRLLWWLAVPRPECHK